MLYSNIITLKKLAYNQVNIVVFLSRIHYTTNEVKKMSKELEIEFKNMLTKDDYQRLVDKYFPNTPAFSQTNCYFDTPDKLLKEKHMGLRLRKRVGHHECTLKIPTDNQHTYQEITDTLTSEQINTLIEQKKIYLDGEVANALNSHHIPLNQLQMIGQITTYRRETQLNDDCLLVLDETHFGKVIDFELEMEVRNSKQGELFFNRFLIEEGIKKHSASKKIVRMIKYLD